jgi:glycosyltransferase involved in cell wall biosynthesis
VNPTESTTRPRFGIVIPACDEAPVIGTVLEELLQLIDPNQFAIIVGVNGSSDATATIAGRYPVVVAETAERGYGYGCMAAIAAAEKLLPQLEAFIFFAGDGASDPHDLQHLVAAYEQGYTFVLGARTACTSNWRVMTLSHVIANFVLACWCGFLAGHRFKDLAPLRLIERNVFHAITPREMTYGWTIEAQIVAAKLGAAICELPARERSRLAGQQKVSGVTWSRTVAIGCRIIAAGLRTHRRFAETASTAAPVIVPEDLLPQAHRGA